MSEAPGLNDDFQDLLRALQDARVDFVVVGAHAMAVHGVPRATGDLDVVVRPTARDKDLVDLRLLTGEDEDVR